MRRNRRWVDQVPVFCLGALVATILAFFVFQNQKTRRAKLIEEDGMGRIHAQTLESVGQIERVLPIVNEMLIAEGKATQEQLLVMRYLLAPSEEYLDRYIRLLKAAGENVSDYESTYLSLKETVAKLPKPAVDPSRRRRVVLPP